MASKRDLIRMTDAEIEAFVDEQRTLQVASINKDGTPHLVAMWFARVDGRLAFWTYAKSQKVLNLRRDPRLTVMLESGAKYAELKGVTVYGTARIIEDKEHVLRFGEAVYERYWGPIDDDLVRDGVHTMGAKRVLIIVESDRVVSWDHAKLGGAY
jgi:PPOX class probable F420-dependent enzyme